METMMLNCAWKTGRWALIAAALVLTGAASTAIADEALWDKIKTQPNIVLLLRHGEIGPARAGETGASFDASGQCRGETMLSPQGREHAARVGKIFKARGVDPHVVSSAMCRTRDTAMLAFGRAELDPALRESATGDQTRFQEFLKASTAWILKYRGPRPLAMVMHLPNIDSLSGEQPEYGEMVVATATGQGELDVLGRIVLYKPPGR